MLSRFLHITGALMLLCAAVIIAFVGVASGFAALVLLGLWMVYLAFEKAQRAFE
jgi:fatty acid desaturase